MKNKLREIISKIIREKFFDHHKLITEDINIASKELNEIMKGYLEAALWTEEERLKDDYESNFQQSNDEEDFDEEESDIDKLIRLKNNLEKKTLEKFFIDDLEDDSNIQAYVDIKSFLEMAGEDAVVEAISENGSFKLGMDIWLTRNGHGAGFFDHSYDHEKELMDAARNLKGVDLYLTDSAKIAFSNAHT